VRVTGALFALGGPSFRNGHDLLGGLRGAAAGAQVQIGTARQTQSLAVGTAEHECGNFQQPTFTNGGTEIDFFTHPADAEREHIGITIDFGVVVGVEEVDFPFDLGDDFDQTPAAFTERLSGELPAEVKPSLSGSRKTTGYPESFEWFMVGVEPDFIVRVEVTCDLNGLGGYSLGWERQHNSEM
jgi:hypothetical protein